MAEEFYIGLMSGTSMDGVDTALVGFESHSKLRLVETYFQEFEPEIRTEINNAAQNNQNLRLNQDSGLHRKLAPIYANACKAVLNKAGFDKGQVKAIANHGQTVKHEPNANPPYSLQLGDGQLIANLTQITTITQFRQGDLAVGGQGAPLMPAFHAAVFGTNNNELVLNIGGIANLTHLASPLVGFDTGPGNVLLDQWIELIRGLPYDKNGVWSTNGTINTELLECLMADSFFTEGYPKSTGTDYFNIAWLEGRFSELHSLKPADVQATLIALSCESIAQDVERLTHSLDEKHSKVYVCGGGARNSALMHSLAERLPRTQIHTTDALGIPSDWLEAIGFAWLGYCKHHGIVSNCPSVTGAHSEVVLGEVFLPS